MKPAPFVHHRPETVDDAIELLERHEEAELLAGNQSLGIVMANRLATPEHLIDLNGVEELAFIDVDADHVEIGAMTRHRRIERSEALASAIPLLPQSAAKIAGPVVRNRGTIGGSLGEADPAGNYATALSALDATLTVRSSDGTREVPIDEFFLAYMFTDLGEHELIERVSIPRGPIPPEQTGMAFLALKRAAQTWPTVSAAAVVRVDDPGSAEPTIEHAGLALANAADVPLRVDEATSIATGTALDEGTLSAVAEAVESAADPEGEMHADPEYKREAAGEYGRRAMSLAYERAIAGDS